ncbi:MAG: YdiU family protein, partial [Candidatus Thiodiazotropha sp. (ex Lucinoma annulata)]|nr:YdiU family protein [Candidatus Thiodiazotropha sp. (ex Lucinoma annulata)]
QPHFEAHYFALMCEKLGLASHNKSHAELVTGWLQHLQDHQLDYSLSFRQLAARMNKKDSPVFGQFEIRWLQCIDEQPGGRQSAGQLMASTNPVVIPRNHQVERAIQAAFQGDFSVFNELRQVLAEPFTEQPGFACYSEPPLAHERVAMTFCGT